MSILLLCDAPPGLVAVFGDPENELEQYELPILKLALSDLGEITAVVWHPRLKRFVTDCTDPVYFPDFLNVIDGGDDGEDEDETDDLEEGEDNLDG